MIERTILTELARLSDEIKAAQKRTGKFASGKSARSLEVKQLGRDSFALLGDKSFLYQQRGSGPHKGQTPEGFVDAIRDWLKVKNIDIPLFAVVNSIREKGTLLYQGKDTPLGLPELFEQTEQRISRVIDAEFSNLLQNMQDGTE